MSCATVNHVTNRDLGDLAADRTRNVGHLHDHARDVVRRAINADDVANAIAQALVEHKAGTQDDEQDHALVRARGGTHLLADRDALEDFVELFDLPIDFGRADPYAAGVQCRVAAAVNHQPVGGGDFRPVAMAPGARKEIEVRGTILRAVGVVPEAHRHRRKRPCAHELAGRATQRRAIRVEHVDRHAEPAALQFAAMHRGGADCPAQSRKVMSVPPEMLAKLDTGLPTLRST